MFTIAPEPFAAMTGIALLLARNIVLRLRFRTRSQSASLVSTTFPATATPMLFTRMSSGYLELFVIGLDHAVWTRWNSSSGLSRWVSLSGYCANTGSPLGLGNIDGYDNWTWYVNCTGGDGAAWYRTRCGGSDGTGTWNGWTSTTP